MSANGTSMSVEGWEELQAALRALSDEVVIKTGNRAARAGATYLKDRIAAALPLGPGTPKLRRNKRGDVVVMNYGHLRDNVKVSALNKRPREKANSAGYLEFSIGPGHAFWGKFLEFGTAKMSARPVWRPVFDSETDATVEKVGNVLRISIARFARK